MYLSLITVLLFVFSFFFSSRRRHTRYWRDWSSDVCSSDLVIVAKLVAGDAPRGQELTLDVFDVPDGTAISTVALAATFGFLSFAGFESAGSRSEERRVGKECRSRGSPYH